MKKQPGRNLRRAGELLLLLALIVIVPSSLPNVSAQVNNLPWLHVEGGRLVDERGSVVVLRGVAVEEPYFLKYIEKRFDGVDFMELSQNWHANVIRVPVSPDLWEHNPNYTQELLDSIVEWGRQYGIYILLGWHAHGNPITGEVSIPDWGSTPPWNGNPYNPNMTLATRFWNQVAERYKDDPWVIYSVFDEPVYISWQEWRPVAEQLVDVIQSHNPRAIMLVPGVAWGYDLRGVGNDPVQRQNIVYETHPYPGKTIYNGPWETYFGYLAGSYPLFAGEWGFVPGSSSTNLNATADSYGTPLIEYMATLGMSWTGWCWSPSWSPKMLQGWNSLPTEFGQLVKDVLAAGLPTSTIFARTTTGSAISGLQVTFGSEVRTTDSSGKAEFSVPAGTYSLAVQNSLSAGSGAQYVFVQWVDGSADNPRSIALNAPVVFEARFKTQYQLTIQVDPSGSATTNPPAGSYWYDSGQSASIQASSAPGYEFRSWAGSGSGSYTGTTNPASVTMNGPVSETASLVSTTVISGTILSVSDTPDPVSRKKTANFAVTIGNTGNIAWSSVTVTIKIYQPDGSLADTASHRQIHLKDSQIQPGNQYTYEISWKAPSTGPKGVWHYEVYVTSGGVLIASSTDPANTITVN